MKATMWAARASLAAGLVVAAGCATRQPPLYLWETFPKMQYDTLLGHGNSPSEQMGLMEAQAEKARAGNVALPPGFRAHLGMLKLASGDVERARDLWRAETAAFPESAPYMAQLLKRLDQPSKKDPA